MTKEYQKQKKEEEKRLEKLARNTRRACECSNIFYQCGDCELFHE